MKIEKETILSEILKVPGAGEILEKHKVPCIGCAFAEQELDKLKVGDVCETYQIDLGKLLKDLNNIGR